MPRGSGQAYLGALIVATAVLCSHMARAQPRSLLLDRVLAIVAGEIITLSDVRAATSLGLVTPSDAAVDPTYAVLTALVERRIMLSEVNRSGGSPPPAAEVDTRWQELRQRFGTAQAFEQALAASGMTSARLRQYLADELRLERYLDLRFSGAAQPADEDVADYLRARPSEFASMPPEAAREQARDRLRAERRAALVADWIARLRRRTPVIELYLPGS